MVKISFEGSVVEIRIQLPIRDTRNLADNHEYSCDNQCEKFGSIFRFQHPPKQDYSLDQGWDSGAKASNVRVPPHVYLLSGCWRLI